VSNGIPLSELMKRHKIMLAGTISPLAIHCVTGLRHMGVDGAMQMELRQVRQTFELQIVEARAEEKRKLEEVRREAAKRRSEKIMNNLLTESPVA